MADCMKKIEDLKKDMEAKDKEVEKLKKQVENINKLEQDKNKLLKEVSNKRDQFLFNGKLEAKLIKLTILLPRLETKLRR